jgi:S-adenosylmethionine:tRNA ribosyltransferase-isomerase
MIPAHTAAQRPADAKLLVVTTRKEIEHHSRSDFTMLLSRGDVVIGNDAATLPASLFGVHLRTGREVEVRLAGRKSLDPDDVRSFSAVAFGEGDYRTLTEERPSPPALRVEDRLRFGSLQASVVELLGHPRFIRLDFTGSIPEIWAGLARYGKPIQYAHLPRALAIWDTWTSIASRPVAFEPASAGFILDWRMLDTMSSRGVEFGTLTHTAGISSTGDPELDRLFPLDEPYEIPQSTIARICAARTRGSRVIAIGTTVVRALEHAAAGSLRPGPGIATQRIGPESALRIVDAIVSGTHEPDSSHYQLLRAFLDDETLRRVDHELQQKGYRTHEFGDSIFVENLRMANL